MKGKRWEREMVIGRNWTLEISDGFDGMEQTRVGKQNLDHFINEENMRQ